MSLGTILVNAEKKIEVVAEDALKFVTNGVSTIEKASPAAVAALGVLGTAVEKSLTDVGSAAANPLNITIDSALVPDFTTAWADAKAFLATLGIKL